MRRLRARSDSRNIAAPPGGTRKSIVPCPSDEELFGELRGLLASETQVKLDRAPQSSARGRS